MSGSEGAYVKEIKVIVDDSLTLDDIKKAVEMMDSPFGRMVGFDKKKIISVEYDGTKVYSM